MFEEFKSLREWGNVVVLTGAGVSAESGIQTFRDANGLWENHNVMEVATPEGFRKNPNLVHRFYNARRIQLKEVEPNAGHFALAKLEEKLGDRFFLITQNVDNLHERAGSQRVHHMHGELCKIRCVADFNHVIPFEESITPEMKCSFPHSQGSLCSAPLRPHIVWFGEIPFGMDKIYKKINECHYFISIGTSGVVYPAAGLVDVAHSNGAITVQMNLEETAGNFKHKYRGKFGELLPQLIESIGFEP